MLQWFLNRNKTDSRLLIQLGKTLPYRNEYSFLLWKKANAMLTTPHITIRKIIYISTGITLVPANRTML